MNKILLFIIIILITSCFPEQNQRDPLIFSYRILYINKIRPDVNLDIYHNVAVILLNIPDTIVTYHDVSNCVTKICLNENIIAAKFYNGKTYSMTESNHLEENKEFNSKCYIGQIDLRTRGVDWKHSIKTNDFHFNDKDGLPMKIEVK